MKKIVFIVIFFVMASMQAQKRQFQVFNAMMIYNQPSLTQYGLKKIYVVYEDSLLTKSSFDYNKINKSFKKIRKNVALSVPICFDIESWDLKSDNANSLKKYSAFQQLFGNNVGKRDYGFFGVIPTTELLLYDKRFMTNTTAQWNTINDNLKQVAQNVTIAYPICYTRGTDMKQWLSVTKAQILKIKQLNKNVKIYPFIWPQYYTKGQAKDGEFLSYNDWIFQLQELYKLVDGVVIWMPPFDQNRKNIDWNGNWQWWTATTDFINKNKLK